MPIYCPRSQFLAGSSHAAAVFWISTNDLSLIMSSLDSWLHGASAGYRVDYVQHNISGIKSNNLSYFRQVWRLLEKL